MHFLAVALLSAAPVALALFDASGPACPVAGQACTFQDTSTTPATTVNAFCAPDLFCGDNGAQCASDNSCYNFCGTDGVCGGLNAECNSQDPSANGQNAITCNTPTFLCDTTTTNTCLLAPSQATRSRRRSLDVSSPPSYMVERCATQDKTACHVPGFGFECIDTTSNLESCGACPGTKESTDCSLLPGVAGVECNAGKCQITACDDGFAPEQGWKSCVRVGEFVIEGVAATRPHRSM
ncbi:hypothetical protein RQP46_003743 [Phenoliferia psychrophenolica]